MPGASQPRARLSGEKPNAAPSPATSAPTPYTPSEDASPASGESTCA
jgi:hypothetical protein